MVKTVPSARTGKREPPVLMYKTVEVLTSLQSAPGPWTSGSFQCRVSIPIGAPPCQPQRFVMQPRALDARDTGFGQAHANGGQHTLAPSNEAPNRHGEAVIAALAGGLQLGSWFSSSRFHARH